MKDRARESSSEGARRLGAELRELAGDLASALLGPWAALTGCLAHGLSTRYRYRQETVDWRWRILCWVRFGVTYDRRHGADGRVTVAAEVAALSDEAYDYEVRKAVRRLYDDDAYAENARALVAASLAAGLRSTPLLVPKFFALPTPDGRSEAPGACTMKIGMTPVVLASASVLALPPEQQRAVFQHEVMHLVADDPRSLMKVAMAAEALLLFARVAAWLVLPALAALALSILCRHGRTVMVMWFHRRAEYRADKAVEPRLHPALVQALEHLAADFDRLSGSTPLPRASWHPGDLWLAHPTLARRLPRLVESGATRS